MINTIMSTIVKLSAVILSDGDIDVKRYTISFTESKEVVDSITSELQEIEGIKLNWKIDKYNNSYRARIYSKKLVEILQRFTKNFRTRPHGTYPFCSNENCINCKERNPVYKEIKLPNMSEKEKKLFIKYYSTCDGGPQFRVRQRKKGSIQIDYSIKIGCCNPFLLNQIDLILKEFGIKTGLRKDGIEIRDIKSIKLFYNNFGFIEESKVRRGKLFNGFKKNDVLRLMILCRIISKKGHWITKNFKTIKNTKLFLRKLIILLENNHIDEIIPFISTNALVSLSPVDISRVSLVEPVPA